MNLSLSLAPLVSLLAGILILVVPRLLNYIVAIYLIVIGLLAWRPEWALQGWFAVQRLQAGAEVHSVEVDGSEKKVILIRPKRS